MRIRSAMVMVLLVAACGGDEKSSEDGACVADCDYVLGFATGCDGQAPTDKCADMCGPPQFTCYWGCLARDLQTCDAVTTVVEACRESCGL